MNRVRRRRLRVTLGPYFHSFGLDDSHPFSPMKLVAVHKGSPMYTQALAEEKKKQTLLSKQALSSCVTRLSQLIVVTDFKPRPDSIWQPGDSSSLLLAGLHTISAVSHAEPTICQPFFCLSHHLTEHPKAIRDRQRWHFNYFIKQVHTKLCV